MGGLVEEAVSGRRPAHLDGADAWSSIWTWIAACRVGHACWWPMPLRLLGRPPGRTRRHKHTKTQLYRQRHSPALQPTLGYHRTAA